MRNLSLATIVGLATLSTGLFATVDSTTISTFNFFQGSSSGSLSAKTLILLLFITKEDYHKPV